jgi:hypothetical protein
MGRDSFSGHSKFVIPQQHYKNAYLALDYVDDDDKSAAKNLIDCLEDFAISLQQTSPEAMIFVLDDGNLDTEFDWELMQTLAPYLAVGSFCEEIEFDGNCVYVGTVAVKNNTHFIEMAQYELITDDNNQWTRGELIAKGDAADWY